MSEVDVHGTILCSFVDVMAPQHLSSDSEGHVLVADCHNDRILLLNGQLQLQRVLVDRSPQVALLFPERLYYNELTSQLCVLHGYGSNIISLFNPFPTDPEISRPAAAMPQTLNMS